MGLPVRVLVSLPIPGPGNVTGEVNKHITSKFAHMELLGS